MEQLIQHRRSRRRRRLPRARSVGVFSSLESRYRSSPAAAAAGPRTRVRGRGTLPESPTSSTHECRRRGQRRNSRLAARRRRRPPHGNARNDQAHGRSGICSDISAKRDHQVGLPFVGGPNSRLTNSMWPTVTILKIKNLRYLSNRLTEFHEIWHDDASRPSRSIRDGRRQPSLKLEKSQYLKNSWTTFYQSCCSNGL